MYHFYVGKLEKVASPFSSDAIPSPNFSTTLISMRNSRDAAQSSRFRRVSNVASAWKNGRGFRGGKGKLLSFFFLLYTFVLYSYFIIQIFSMVLSLLQCLFLNISKSNRGFCERGYLNQVLVLNVFFFFF